MTNLKRNIPNTITGLNLISGGLSIYASIYLHNWHWAIYLILLAAFFDFFDGLAARALGVSSPIGKDLDSLADVVSFGLAPSFLVIGAMQQIYTDPLKANLFLFFLFLAYYAALRLAKFNNDTRQTTSFIGLAVPSNALFWIGYTALVMQHSDLIQSNWLITFIVTMCIGFCFSYLMISELPMFSLKIKKGQKKLLIRPIILLIVTIVAFFFIGFGAFAITIILYIAMCALEYKKDNQTNTKKK